MQIIPAILATSEEQYLQDLQKIESFEEIVEGDWVQIDFMDNKFVQNKSIEPNVVTQNLPKLKIEAQMMVQNPLYWMDQLTALKPTRVIVPIEVGENTVRFLTEARGKFSQIGLSLNPETTVDKLQPYLNKIDAILIMSVHPGFQQQEFLVEVLAKVEECFQLRLNNNLKLLIGVDGGITAENVKLVANVGADYAVVGSHLLKGDIVQNLQKFKANLK